MTLTIAGKGDGIPAGEDVLYYMQLLYEKSTSYTAEQARDMAYGNELHFIPVPGSPELGFRQAPREGSYYVEYRGKGVHLTGDGNETIPTIELLLKIPRSTTLESIVLLKNHQIGRLKVPTSADLGFTVRSGSSEEVGDFLRQFGIVAEQCSYSLKGEASEPQYKGLLSVYSFSKVFVSGRVEDVMRLYASLPNAFQRNKSLQYKDLALTFH